MCIALISTAHPTYSLIIIDNRDEFLRRPTSSPDWWPEPCQYVLGSRDLARATHGTWMGVTKQGKVAVLTNYREDKSNEAVGVHSRGRIVNSWLTSSPEERQTTDSFVQAMVASPEAKQVGGFSLVCGRINEPLAIVSNRSSDMDHITWVAAEKNQTRGLSNTSVDDRTWPKILDGEKLMESAIQEHVKAGSREDEDALINRLLKVLSKDTLPQLSKEESNIDTYIQHLRKSIFIPIIGESNDSNRGAEEIAAAQVEDETLKPQANNVLEPNYSSGPYGTQKQTILLAQPDGRVRYFERTLYDNNVQAVPIGQGDRSFEFQVEE
ncbi:uncharacterized protein N7459_009260 [Penicillium hispanicum]|uniref:uncharacterized protein n=1 Tax=Penicillium hispanicum TaxID=1080232 RepID=UPI00254083B2|nr:uncharacterized protein N7459_009260 [Penicillium hispanicum]KAJ5569830.1 hypothetical protein N7459_009260 [Penicillium hispanicum]